MIYPSTILVVLPFIMILLIILYMYIVRDCSCEGMTNKENQGDMGEEPNNQDRPSPEYNDSGLQNDPIYLSKINAANITTLKEDVKEIESIKQMLNDLNSKVDDNTSEIQGLLIQNQISS